MVKQQALDSGSSPDSYLLDPHPCSSAEGVGYEDKSLTRQRAVPPCSVHTGRNPRVIRLEEDKQVAM